MEKLEGIVVKSTGSWYDVRLKSQEIVPARTVGKMRLNGLKVTNPVAVGDRVHLEIKSGEYLIKEILDRKNYVIRQSPRKKHYLHILASNIDQALLLVTMREPNFKQGFIDRFLLMTEPYEIPVQIVFNKKDLYTEDDLDVYGYFKAVYENLGYHVHLISTAEAEDIKKIRSLLSQKTTLISGQSGVGKSTLINGIDKNLTLRIGELSDYTGKGQHTTTFAEMYSLGDDTHIIDTPGIKSLSYNHMEVQDVAHNFREMFALSPNCKFSNCTHRNEPKCAVKDAVENEEISIYRYDNYLAICKEIEDQNYWEIKTNF